MRECHRSLSLAYQIYDLEDNLNEMFKLMKIQEGTVLQVRRRRHASNSLTKPTFCFNMKRVARLNMSEDSRTEWVNELRENLEG